MPSELAEPFRSVPVLPDSVPSREAGCPRGRHCAELCGHCVARMVRVYVCLCLCVYACVELVGRCPVWQHASYRVWTVIPTSKAGPGPPARLCAAGRWPSGAAQRSERVSFLVRSVTQTGGMVSSRGACAVVMYCLPCKRPSARRREPHSSREKSVAKYRSDSPCIISSVIPATPAISHSPSFTLYLQILENIKTTQIRRTPRT